MRAIKEGCWHSKSLGHSLILWKIYLRVFFYCSFSYHINYKGRTIYLDWWLLARSLTLVLSLPVGYQEFLVYTNASEVGLGACSCREAKLLPIFQNSGSRMRRPENGRKWSKMTLGKCELLVAIVAKAEVGVSLKRKILAKGSYRGGRLCERTLIATKK